MSIQLEWPAYSPDVTLEVDVTNGVMTLISPSKLENHADFDLSAPNVRGTVTKNGVTAGSVTIDGSTGALSIAGVAVSAGDAIVFEFKALGQLTLPWMCRVSFVKLLFLTIPAGSSRTTFDASTNAMPVPSFDLAFGWTANGNLQAGVKVSDADGATQNLTLYTRLFGACPNQESSTSVSLSNTSTAQTETSTFAKGAMNRDAEIEWWLKSGTGSTRQEERVRIAWSARDDVPSYPTSFPTSGTQLKQTKLNGAVKLYRP